MGRACLSPLVPVSPVLKGNGYVHLCYAQDSGAPRSRCEEFECYGHRARLGMANWWGNPAFDSAWLCGRYVFQGFVVPLKKKVFERWQGHRRSSQQRSPHHTDWDVTLTVHFYGVVASNCLTTSSTTAWYSNRDFSPTSSALGTRARVSRTTSFNYVLSV